MSFPKMNTGLTKRLVFNKQADKRESKGRQGVRKVEIFTGSYVLSFFEYKSHRETCIQQASRQEREKADRE